MNTASSLRESAPDSVLALKIAAPVGLVGGLAALFVPGVPLWTAAAVAAGLAGGTYTLAYALLHPRLLRAHSMLEKIGDREFEDLESPPGPRGDELDALLWEVYHTGQSLKEEIQEFKEMESYRREFIGNVSHELKTPIFSVQGFAETLLDGALDDEAVNRTFLEKILNNVNRLENLTRDLSTISKIETDELEMSHDEFEVSDVFEATFESVEVKAEEKHITVYQEVESDLPAVYGDRERIRRVLVNLADNAIKYNENGGTVVLRATSAADGVEIGVTDDGIGIPEEHLPRLTERFYRVDKSRSRNQGGTGLGLAIVKHILAAHNSSLRVDSTPDRGSTFSFTLPAARTSTLQPAN